MIDLQDPANEAELKARILAEVIKNVAALPGPSDACTIFESVRQAIDLPEAFIGGHIYSSIFFLIRTGVFDSPSYDKKKSEIGFSCDTVIIPSERLIAYIWTDPEYIGDDEMMP
jgi:hypothetical protein